MYMMHLHLQQLLDRGYTVQVERFNTKTDPARYWAHVEPTDPDGTFEGCTAEGPTPSQAIWNASPLHADDEPYPDAELSNVILAIMREAQKKITAHVRQCHAEHSAVNRVLLDESFKLGMAAGRAEKFTEATRD